MKNLFALLLLGLFTITAFNSCEKKASPISSIGYDGLLFEGEEIRFKSANTDADVFEFNFGDGNLKTSYRDGTASNVYNVAGTYKVTLTITNENGSHTSTIDVVIKPLPRKVKITRVILNNFDSQINWDSDQSGPDIYFRVGTFNGPSHAASDPISSLKENRPHTSLPVIWDLPQPMELNYERIKSSKISFYDVDMSASAYMGSILFSLSEQMPFNKNTIELVNNDFNLAATLDVEYIY